MATANFHSRIKRIEQAQTVGTGPESNTRNGPGKAVHALAGTVVTRRRHPLADHIMAAALGIFPGCLVAVALIGLSWESAPWGPGSAWYSIVFYPTMLGLALAPVLILFAVCTAVRRPSVALFALGYLSGVLIPVFI